MSLAMWLEGAAVRMLARVFGALPPATASNVAGALAGWIGPLLPVSRVARANLALAMPDLDATARRRIVRQSWAELGRTVGEFPHVAHLRATPTGPGFEVAGQDVLAAALAKGGPVVFVSGHIGNWEIIPHVARAHGIPVAIFYRAAQNPNVDALIQRLRTSGSGPPTPMFRKGGAGARQAMAHLRNGGSIAMLVDQKLNNGAKLRFFGRPAMTATAAASFALHFHAALVPVRTERIGPARLRLVVEPPLALPLSGDKPADILAVTQQINDLLERWIRGNPAAWLWMHRRWPKPATDSGQTPAEEA